VGARVRSGSLALPLIVVLLVLLVVDQTRLTLGYARHWVNEDNTLLWYAARDLGRGRFMQPTFYGESYFTVFDAFPAELMRRAGVSLATAMALGEAALNIGGWPLLALAAYRRGHRVMAAAALAVPLVLPFEFLIASEKGSGAGAGVFLAMAGAAVLIAAPRRPANVGLFFALGSLGLAWNYTIVYLVVPAAAYAVVVNIRSRAVLGSAALGTVPGGAWLAYADAFVRRHPDYNLHKQVDYRLSLGNLERALRHSSRYFGWEAPELIRWVGIPIAAAFVLLVAVAWSRRVAVVVPAIVGIALIVVSLASRKVLDGTPSAYLGYGRFFLAIPAFAWFVLYALADTRSIPRPSWLTTNVVIMVIAVTASASFVGRNLSFSRRLDHIAAVAERPSAGAPIKRTSAVITDCLGIAEAARRARTDLVVYRYDRTGAYGCGALEYGRIETLFPDYDRRTWLVHREASLERTVFLAVGVDQAWCAQARTDALVRSCVLEQGVAQVAVVRTAPIPVLTLWRDLGEAVRPFDAPRART
jgi:hypothetical protein